MTLATLEPAQHNLTNETILAQMERVLASRHFRQTRTLDKFLRHAIAKTLAGLESELKESLIGREVFHRGEDFNPAMDAVVRVQAGMLRKKLASYYAEEGQADPLIIDLPKGCYVPTFHARELPEPLPETNHPLIPLPASPPNRAKATAQFKTTHQLRWPLPIKWQSAAAFAIGMVLMFAIMQWRNRGTVAPLAGKAAVAHKTVEQGLLWENFFEPGATTMLAYGTPQFFQFKGLYLRDVMVNSPQEADQEVGVRLASVRKVFKQPLNPIEVYTGVGEAHGIHLLTRFFGQHARELEIARSRLVGWQEVKNANLIFLSSMRFHTLAEQLDYPNDFVINPQRVEGTIANLRPAAGEQAEYAIGGGEHYAVITLWPGKAERRRILQLGGNTTWGTLAAAEYATDAESLRKLHEVLEQCRQKHGWTQHPPYFQVLVRAEVKDEQPIALTYVTHHDLEVPSAGQDSVRVALK